MLLSSVVSSPLLANIYLNPLDWLMGEAGFKTVRYADDMVVMCQSPQEARRALERIGQWMEHMGLNSIMRKAGSLT